MVRGLSAQEIIDAWEMGLGRHPLDRALLLLALAGPELDGHDGEPAALPIGRRDELLLRVHELTFGAELSGSAACERCSAPLEFSVPAASLRVQPPAESSAATHELVLDGGAVRFRLPDSRDLGMAARAGDAAAARELLLARCVAEPRALSESELESLARRMGELDPQAEILLDLDCEGCGEKTQVLLDISAYLWAEVAAEARRLMRQVHALASAYGWREADVLALGARRRHAYLEMAGA